jgi:cytochrome c peroxidase
VLSLNTPTILNRAFSNPQFFDGRAATMEEQAVGPNRTGLIPESPANPGRFLTTGQVRDLFAFKTPTLRNIADTAPYFHDGSVETLEDVVELYNEGSVLPGHDWEIRPLR